jgi:uncharacterized glyoxalase superfamily protein PhnB
MPQNPPKDWPRIAPALIYDDPAAAIDWLCRAFGFEVRLKVEGDAGEIEHSELVLGEGLIMVSSPKRRPQFASPRSLGGKITQGLMVFVEDVDKHCARARAAGAKITTEIEVSDYGDDYWADRHYEAEDPEGHLWWFTQRVRDPGEPR